MSRKIRSDSKVFDLMKLEHHQQDQLADWLLVDGISYKKARERVRLDFGVVASKGAIETFWERVCSPRQFAQLADAADAMPDATGGLEANWEASSRAYVKQRYFQLLASRNANPEEVRLFGEMVAAIGKADLERDKLAFNKQKDERNARIKRDTLNLSREKFQRDTCELFLKWVNDERAKAITSSGASNAEKIEALGQAMFGEDWTQ